MITTTLIAIACGADQGAALPSGAQPNPTNNDVVDAPKEFTALQEFLIDPFEKPIGHSMILWDVKNSIVNRFGPPHYIDTSKIPARTSDEQLRSHEMGYPDVTFFVGENEDGSRSWLDVIDITGDRLALKHGLRVGSSKQEIVAKLGQSNLAQVENTLTFEAEISESGQIEKNREILDVRIDGIRQLTVTLDASGKAKKFIIENIEY